MTSISESLVTMLDYKNVIIDNVRMTNYTMIIKTVITSQVHFLDQMGYNYNYLDLWPLAHRKMVDSLLVLEPTNLRVVAKRRVFRIS